VTGARRAVVGGAATLGATGLVAAGVLTVLNAFWVIPLLPAVGAAGLAWLVTRSFRPIADRIQLGLERALDHVEGNAIKPPAELAGRGPGLIDLLTTEVRKAIASGKLTPPTRKPRDR
jgi:hypothetical protein